MGPIETALIVGGTAVAVPVAKKLLEKILGPSADLLGEKLKDNLVSVIAKAETMSEEASLELQRMPTRTGVAILQFAIREDDEAMQTRWAALLANAARSDAETEVPPSFPGILSALSPSEAKLLDAIYDRACEQATVNPGVITLSSYSSGFRFVERTLRLLYHEAGLSEGLWIETLGDYEGLSEDEKETLRVQGSRLAVAVDNLVRLGLLSRGRDTRLDPRLEDRSPGAGLTQSDYYLLSQLGLEFVKACRKPPSK